MPGKEQPERYDRHTLARLSAAKQPSPAGSRQPCVRPIETSGFQPVIRGRHAMMPPVLPAGSG